MPTPQEIKEARAYAGLTQTQAANLVHVSLNAWQKWEGGRTKMSETAWDLFLIKTKRQQIVDKAKIKEADMQDLDVIIQGQLEDAYGKGSEYKVITHDGAEPRLESGLMYGNDECIEDYGGNYGKLYTFFQPYDSCMVYKCYFTIPEGEMDWSNIDYASPEDIEISDYWG